MDVYCPKCGNELDIDSLHEIAEEKGWLFDQVRRAFFTEGCMSTGWFTKCEPADDHDRNVAAISALAYEMLGSDIDGIAAEMEDAKMLGMFDG